MRFAASTLRRGFTLVELLIVLAILAILAGMLFPVFAAARRSAQASACLANFRGATRAAGLYTADYDDALFPMRYATGEGTDPALDPAWPQLLRPYAGGAGTFDCPTDRGALDYGASFDPDLTPGDYAARDREAARHADLGYNAFYLAPMLNVGGAWVARPRTNSGSANVLLFVESRGHVGGSYLVAPPCRYVVDHARWVDTFQSEFIRPSWQDPDPVYTEEMSGWSLLDDASHLPRGGVGSRHGDRLNVAYLDGHARTSALPTLTRGCQVKADWGGSIRDLSRYPWYPGG